MSALPVTEMLDWEQVNAAQRDGIRQVFGILFALSFFMIVGPKAISLFPGIMRSSMTLKTMLPEASAPGWASVMVAPVYSIFLIMVASTIIQVQGSTTLLVGIAFLMAAPLVYLFKANDVLLPHNEQDAARIVVGVRRLAGVFNAIGTILLAIFLIENTAFGILDALRFGLSVGAGIALLTVVASDFILALLWTSYTQNKAFQGTDLQASLERKFEDLGAAGLTMLRAKAAPALAEAPSASADAPVTASAEASDEDASDTP